MGEEEELKEENAENIEEFKMRLTKIDRKQKERHEEATTSEEFKFNLKLTDLSDLENPFVIYEDLSIDKSGHLLIA